MINFHHLIVSGAIGWPLIILTFVVLYLVFLRPEKDHK